MKKRLFFILTLICLLVFSASASVFAEGGSSGGSQGSGVNVNEMAVYLNHDFKGQNTAVVDGSIYTANGNVQFDDSGTSNIVTGNIYHKAGTQVAIPSRYDFGNRVVALPTTQYSEAYPDVMDFPDFGTGIDYIPQWNTAPLTISENTHFRTLKVDKNDVTVDVSKNDIYVVVDKLSFGWASNSPFKIKLNGNGKLFLFVNSYDAGGAPITIDSTDPNKVYIFSKCDISHNNMNLSAHVIFDPSITSLNFKGKLTGSIVTNATALTLESGNTSINGLVYAPKAAALVQSPGQLPLIKGRLVADNLMLKGSGNIIYDPTYASYSQAVPPQVLKYQLSVSTSDPAMGTVSPTAQQVRYGQVITVTASPNAGYVFTGFTSSNSSMIPDSSGKLTVTGSANLVAHFEPAGEYVKGILGEYYDSGELTNETALRMKRIDSNIAFNFMYDSPDSTVDPETFAIRWTGYIKPTVSGNYTFKTYSDDGIIVTVNGTAVIDNWGLLSLAFTEASTPVYLEAGKYYPITVQYQQMPLYAAAFLFWEADNVPMTLIPDTAFYIKEPVYNEVAGTKYFNTLDKSGSGFTNTFYALNDSGDKISDSKYSEINNIDYWWTTGAPGGITTDTFYGEMEGDLEARCTEATTLQFLVDDGIRVWIDGNLVIDKWDTHNVESFEYSFNTEVGKKYHMKIEYIDMGLGATCVMRWKSPSIGEESIPAKYMFVN